LLSAAALMQFFVSYCRSLVTVYSEVELSPKALRLAGLQSREVPGDEFRRLVQLVELCPVKADDRMELRAIRLYYLLLDLLRSLRPLAAGLASWADCQRAGCAHFAAVALDRRVSNHYSAVT
jgi:hypothetical protein